MSTYYNDSDPYVAQWLRNLIKAGHLPDGEVDERSIVEVQPGDVAAFTHCHFFAGIGGWAYAMRLAGWPEERPLWTGSCPCQPFSAAGQRLGTADARHLWPHFFRLIQERKPAGVVGEQVASKLGRSWLSGVRADLEGVGYAVGAADLGAAGVGAPHIRQRLWWVADADAAGRRELGRCELRSDGFAPCGHDIDGCRCDGGLAFPSASGRGALLGAAAPYGRPEVEPDGHSFAERLGEPSRSGLEERPGERRDDGAKRASVERTSGAVSGMGDAERQRNRIEQRLPAAPRWNDSTDIVRADRSSFWSDAEYLQCTDGKSRPVEPDTFPLAHGVPARVGRLRAYGNAINPYCAAEVLKAWLAVSP